VAEFGGRGNIASVTAALRAVLGPLADEQSPWYYPSIGEYAPLLERYGLEVREASLFDRPTPLEGENGLHQCCACSRAPIWTASRPIVPHKSSIKLWRSFGPPFIAMEYGPWITAVCDCTPFAASSYSVTR
jgi:hypothetical protein